MQEIKKSRVGDNPIKRIDSVSLDWSQNLLRVKGIKGELELRIPAQFKLSIGDENILVEPVKRDDMSKECKAIHGTIRQLVFNMIHGVSQGFEKILLLQGVGYRAQISGNKLTLNLGFSLPVEYRLPETVSAKVDGNKIILVSCDKQLVGQTAAEIRAYRPPEPYKGKGVRYDGEHIIRKAGKTGKKE